MCFGVTARECSADREWTECMSTCGSTCESLSAVGSADTGSCSRTAADCLPGCQCHKGTVFDRSQGDQGSCVAPTECTCRHQGTVYPPQSTITVDCNEWFVLMLFQFKHTIIHTMTADHYIIHHCLGITHHA